LPIVFSRYGRLEDTRPLLVELVGIAIPLLFEIVRGQLFSQVLRKGIERGSAVRNAKAGDQQQQLRRFNVIFEWQSMLSYTVVDIL
jgi:hypothetical protein